MEKLSPGAIERERIAQWLARNAAFPLRALIAPAGYGKTTAIVRYLAGLDELHAYVRARPGDRPEHLAVRLNAELGFPEIASFEGLRARLSATPACTIAIDALDLASDEASFELGRFAIASPPNVRTIVAACRGNAINTPRLFAQGLAASLGSSLLAFTVDDVTQLCASLGVDARESDIRAVAGLSDGWPALAGAIVRAAASEGRPLNEAYEVWQASGVQTLRRFVEAEVKRAPVKARILFARAVAGELLHDEEWQILESCGLFVVDDGGQRLLYPVGAMYSQGAGLRSKGFPQRLAISLFAAFEVSCGGTAIRWLRRRDTDIVRMLAVRGGGTATRSELIERFWPATPRRAAQQSLRTSCSNIRKAIAAVTGPNRVDRYFSSGTDVTLHTSAILLDAHRFLSHVHSGDDAFKNRRRETAVTHYRAALRLHRGKPAVDAGDEVQRAFAVRLEEAYDRTRQRLEEIETATPEAARKLGSSDRASAARSSRAAS